MTTEATETPWVWFEGDRVEFYVSGMAMIGRIDHLYQDMVFVRSEGTLDGSGWWRSEHELTRIAEDWH